MLRPLVQPVLQPVLQDTLDAALPVGEHTPSPPAAPVNRSLPLINGTPTVGQTLSAAAGAWSGKPAPTYGYQWLRDAVPISGATSSTYELQAADYGKVISVTVVATNSEGSDSATSAGTAAVAGIAPANTAAPSISGTTTIGETLTGSDGSWTGAPTPSLSRQWLRDGEPISGATSSTYELVNGDYGAFIAFRVTATNPVDSAVATSNYTAAVAGVAPANTAPPVVTGDAVVGETLTCSLGSWTGSPVLTMSRQWRRDGVDIEGETDSSYTLVEGDVGAYISCRVTAANEVDSAFEDSNAVGPVEAAEPADPEWFALIDATKPASMYHNSNLTGQPVVDTNRVGAVLDTTANNNHWRHAHDASARTEYKSAGGGMIEISGNYWRAMVIDNTSRLVDIRKPWWFAMAMKLGGAIDGYVVLLDRDYDGNNELAAVIEDGKLLLERKISASTLTAEADGASAITTSVWGVISVGYDGSNITARVNLGDKGITADSRSLPDAVGDAPLRQGQSPSAFHVKALGFLDYYPGEAEENAAIEAVADLAGIEIPGGPGPDPDPDPDPVPDDVGTFLRLMNADLWNAPLNPNAEYESSSDNATRSFLRSRRWQPTVGPGNYGTPGGVLNVNTNGDWNYPIWQATEDDPLETITCSSSWSPTNYNYPVTIRIPAAAEPPGGTDAPLCIVDPTGTYIDEFGYVVGSRPNRQARVYSRWYIDALGTGGGQGGTIFYDSGIVTSSVPGVPGRASGLPMAAGVLRLEWFDEDLFPDGIPQMLISTMGGNDMCTPYSWPSSRDDWWMNYPNNSEPGYTLGDGDAWVQTGYIFGIPPGTSKPGGLTPAASKIWDALVKYGLVIGDRSGESSLLVDGSRPMSAWNAILDGTTKTQLKNIVGPALRRVKNVSALNPRG